MIFVAVVGSWIMIKITMLLVEVVVSWLKVVTVMILVVVVAEVVSGLKIIIVITGGKGVILDKGNNDGIGDGGGIMFEDNGDEVGGGNHANSSGRIMNDVNKKMKMVVLVAVVGSFMMIITLIAEVVVMGS